MQGSARTTHSGLDQRRRRGYAVMERSMQVTCLLLVAGTLPSAVLAWSQGCITGPVGFGRSTTGGAGGKTVTPASTDELKNYLRSSDTLIIDLTKTFDYTNGEGFNTETGCVYNDCGTGSQDSLNLFSSCKGRKTTEVTYSVAGSRTLELIITSHKTVMSSNGLGVIKGKGVRVNNANNVIIRDITISDINPGVIWAGDGIVLSNVQNVWIHRVTTRNIGRQHLVTYVQPNTGVTVSSCLFDGSTSFSAYCDGTHYWMWLFWGTRDEVTLINNRVVNAAGRVPHAGGQNSNYKNLIHLIGNELDTSHHEGLQAYVGGYILAEGNKFINYANVIDKSATNGFIAIINTAAEAATCKNYFGENCKQNAYQSSTAPTRIDTTVLDQFSKLDQTAIKGARAAACEV